MRIASQKLNILKIKNISAFIIIIGVLISLVHGKPDPVYDNNCQLLDTTSYEDANHIYQVCYAVWELVNSSSDCALKIANQALPLTVKHGDSLRLAFLYSQLGLIHFDQGDFNKSLSFFLKVIEIYENRKIKNKFLALAYDYLGKLYTRNGVFAESIKAHEKSINIIKDLIAKTDQDVEKSEFNYLQKTLCFYYNNIGDAYKRLSDDKYSDEERQSELLYEDQQALDYFRKHLIVAQTFPDPTEYIKGCVNTASVFREIGYLDTALAYILRGEEKFFAMEDSIQAISRQVLASIFTQKGRIMEEYCNFSEATSLHHSARKIYSELKDYSLLVLPLLNLGNTYERFGYLDSALFYYQSALKIEKDSLTIIEDGRKEKILRSLSNVYEKQGNFQKAYENFKLFGQSKIHTLIQQRDTSILYVKANVELQRKNDKSELKAKYEERKSWMIGLIGFGLILGIGVVSYLKNKNKDLALAKSEAEKKTQKEQFNNKMSQMVRKSEDIVLITRNETQEEVLKKTGMELHDSLGGLLAASKREFELLKKIALFKDPRTEEQFEYTKNILQQAINEMRRISHQLSYVPQGENLLYALKETIKMFEHIPNSPKIEFLHQHIQERSFTSKEEIYLLRIVQEALTNIIKYADASKVSIQLISSSDLLKLDIEDDGKGFDSSSCEAKDGIGMANMKNRAEELKGEFECSSSPGKGTKIVVSIPLSQVS